ncbi:AAA family ATPase [Myxococcus sp. AM009]|uniref:AAA family ATPase n=1 Tax=Myxococcus sp. AM009 TaxID=2745137 RepID=UPI0015963150|nr:AAA family ATPase [Myxococcus sp. AM009]NVI99782.1 AAA family ATPase [Myxococcus sp. AM009]
MNLDRLQIESFKNLKDFEIVFDKGENSLVTVIVGQNGTGKSNLLEALIIIFRDLDLGSSPAFRYKLDYTCRGASVHIDADPRRERESVQVTVNGTAVTYKKFIQGDPRYLPTYVFGYYSGPSNRMESHFEQHHTHFYKALVHGDDRPLRPLFYARLVHSQFVLLAFFTEQDAEALKFLSTELRIEGLDSVLFVMKQPDWSKSRRAQAGDPRFWGAKGVVRGFLDKLYALALAPLRLPRRLPTPFGTSGKQVQHLYLYLRDLKALQDLASSYQSQQEFFKALESTYISDLISEVRIRVKARNVDGTLTFRELSEGEQQLLMVLGLLRFTREDESLFLLDEPDTHLNPTWSMRYIEQVNKVVGKQETSHIIMTTHDPLVIAGLKREEIRIMHRESDTGRVAAERPEQAPQGMGVEAILTSDLFGLRSTLDLPTLRLLDEKRKLAVKDTLSEPERERLAELNEQLGDLDFTRTVPDPLYRPFVRAMSKLQEKGGLLQPVLTPDEVKKKEELADRIVEELASEPMP